MKADKRLRDATRPLVVVIAEQDRDATPCSPSHCIVANRLLRLSWVTDARVGAEYAYLHASTGWQRYQHDPSTAAGVKAYDDANERMPAGFRVVLLPPRRKLGSRQGEASGSSSRSGSGSSVVTRAPSSRSIYVEPPT